MSGLGVWDMMAELKLDNGRRIAKRFAKLHHMESALALAEADAADLLRKVARMRQELTLLRPFWAEGMTKEQAVAAYEAHQAAKAVTTPSTPAAAANGVG
jgi:hypothetical protein